MKKIFFSLLLSFGLINSTAHAGLMTSLESELFDAINDYRVNYGLSALIFDERLQQISDKAVEQTIFSHIGDTPTGYQNSNQTNLIFTNSYRNTSTLTQQTFEQIESNTHAVAVMLNNMKWNTGYSEMNWTTMSVSYNHHKDGLFTSPGGSMNPYLNNYWAIYFGKPAELPTTSVNVPVSGGFLFLSLSLVLISLRKK